MSFECPKQLKILRPSLEFFMLHLFMEEFFGFLKKIALKAIAPLDPSTLSIVCRRNNGLTVKSTIPLIVLLIHYARYDLMNTVQK